MSIRSSHPILIPHPLCTQIWTVEQALPYHAHRTITPPHTLSKPQRLCNPLDHRHNILAFRKAGTLFPPHHCLQLLNIAKLMQFLLKRIYDKNLASDKGWRRGGVFVHPLPSSLVQFPHVHNSVSEEAPLLLDVVICMDLKKKKRRWGGFPGHSWVNVTTEACWIKKAGSLIRRWRRERERGEKGD